MFSTYRSDDVTILLKDITGMVEPMGTRERETLIQSGHHYSEMLPIEYEPSEKYLRAYYDALGRYAKITATAVAVVGEKIYRDKGDGLVLVSLARAGTPIAILIRHYLQKRYHIDVPHYTISIIRGLGIDKNAMSYILTHHRAENIQFVDGWTGKGAIQRELNKAMDDYPGVSAGLAVLSDPAYVAEKCGTHEDFLIASSCLNSTVSGLLSRTFLRTDIIGPQDFHGAVFYKDLMAKDLTDQFIEEIEKNYPLSVTITDSVETVKESGLQEVNKIADEFGIRDINLVKPGIGEATRVLLRRLPWKLLVYSLHDEEKLGHLYELAREKGVEVVEYPMQNYLACGLIQSLADN